MSARHRTPRGTRRLRLSGALIALLLVALGVLGAAGGGGAFSKTLNVTVP